MGKKPVIGLVGLCVGLALSGCKDCNCDQKSSRKGSYPTAYHRQGSFGSPVASDRQRTTPSTIAGKGVTPAQTNQNAQIPSTPGQAPVSQVSAEEIVAPPPQQQIPALPPRMSRVEESRVPLTPGTGAIAPAESMHDGASPATHISVPTQPQPGAGVTFELPAQPVAREVPSVPRQTETPAATETPTLPPPPSSLKAPVAPPPAEVPGAAPVPLTGPGSIPPAPPELPAASSPPASTGPAPVVETGSHPVSLTPPPAPPGPDAPPPPPAPGAVPPPADLSLPPR
jgi:hypothetical protein